MTDPRDIEPALLALQAGNIFQARRRLVQLHEPGRSEDEPVSGIVEALWGLDFQIRMTAFDDLGRALHMGTPVEQHVLRRLHLILERRKQDLKVYIDRIELAAAAATGSLDLKGGGHAEEEHELKQALVQYARGDRAGSFESFCRVNDVNDRRLAALDALISGARATQLDLQMLTPPPGGHQIAIEAAEWRELIDRASQPRPRDETGPGFVLGEGAASRLEFGVIPETVVAQVTTMSKSGRLDLFPELAPYEIMAEGSPERRSERRDDSGLSPEGTHNVAEGRPPLRGRRSPSRRRRTKRTPLRRTPHMHLSRDEPLPPDAEFTVHVFADTAPPEPGEEAEEIVVDFPPRVKRVEVMVHIITSQHLQIVDSDAGAIVITRGQDRSSTAAFRLRVQSERELVAAGQNAPWVGTLTAIFRYQGRPSGKVSRTVRLGTSGQGANAPGPPSPPPETRTADALLVETNAREPDLLVQIMAAEVNNTRAFRSHVFTPLLPANEQEPDGPWSLPGVARTFVTDCMEHFVKERLAPAERLAHLKGAGVGFFNASPPNFQKVFWKLIDADAPLKSIAVVSDEPYVPWELMIPERDKEGRRERREPLGVEFSVGRWIVGNGTSAPQTVPLRDSLVLAPLYKGKHKLKHAEAESMFVVKSFKGTPVRPAQFETLLAFLKSERATLFHFACHGAASTPVSQVIYLDDDKELHSVQVQGSDEFLEFFQQTKAMVFLNACETGRPLPALVGIGGFAKVFVDLGASAVIAPLWSVKDDIAHEIALEFYECLQREPTKPFGEILSNIRAKAYSEAAVEDTYAAYCFYGDPLASQSTT